MAEGGCGPYCAGCEKVKLNDDEYLCPGCRRRLRIGELVVRMGEGQSLIRNVGFWIFIAEDAGVFRVHDHESLIEALEKGVKE